MQKKILLIVTISLIVLATSSLLLLWRLSNRTSYQRFGIEAPAIVNQKEFLVFQNRRLQPMFVKGVNIGAAKPFHFPGELAITKEEYLRWFEWIHAMNANTIRVYTTMMPHFYEALAEFNRGKAHPLYLIQGVWLDEDAIKRIGDAYGDNGFLQSAFTQDALDLVDIIHGNKYLAHRAGFASGSYSVDINQYVIGWMIGVEWDPTFVQTTNHNHPDKPQYHGNHLYTKYASPFEIFLAEVMDHLLTYEMDQYRTTRPISFVNWLTTDPLTHDNEPDPKEDLVGVDFEHIRLHRSASAGMYASYHVYPYYPEFINVQPEYTRYIDFRGEANPYLAYLNDLNKHHSIPVLIAEFGLPASRGKAHNSFKDGFSQGNLSETMQGQQLTKLIEDIVASGSAGALLFAWQDEWFKRTWNTMDYDLEWRRPFWSNVETNEQMFGLLSFDPGESEVLIHLDGNPEDWQAIGKNHALDPLQITHDARYLYLSYQHHSPILANQRLVFSLRFDELEGALFWSEENIRFSDPVQFLLVIENHQARFMVVSSYNPTTYLYDRVLALLPAGQYLDDYQAGVFQVTQHVLSNELFLPKTMETIPFSMYESGLLRKGFSSPKHVLYDSLSEYQHSDTFYEVRIPWLLLNIMDPSTKIRMKSFESSFFEGVAFEHIRVGVGLQADKHDVLIQTFIPYTWDEWHVFPVHERLKPSYYAIQAVFERIK